MLNFSSNFSSLMVSGMVSGFIAVASLTACSGGNNPDLATPPPATREDAKNISGVTFLKGATNLIYASTPLSETESANHYELGFNLQPGGSLTLLSNAILLANTGVLDRAVEVEFRRSTDANDANLTVLVRASGAERNWSQFFTSLDARGPVAVSLDIHNDHGGEAHIIAWGADHENPIFNSGIRTSGGSPGRGFGPRWGFRLNDATLNTVALETPHDEH